MILGPNDPRAITNTPRPPHVPGVSVVDMIDNATSGATKDLTDFLTNQGKDSSSS